jgi:hypothetical protein
MPLLRILTCPSPHRRLSKIDATEHLAEELLATLNAPHHKTRPNKHNRKRAVCVTPVPASASSALTVTKPNKRTRVEEEEKTIRPGNSELSYTDNIFAEVEPEVNRVDSVLDLRRPETAEASSTIGFLRCVCN